jgi:eukaryotic-like serine/threonine-protein kinase
MSIVPGSRVGVYEVTSRLGEGAMGVVFRARDSKLLRDVALKVLPAQFANDPDRLTRLHREAQVLASLNHPNIAHVYGLEQVGGSECIVMEFVEGETLEERLTHGRIPVHDAIEIAKQLADGLAAAHERGIVHRDLKPANVKLTPSGGVKILDFGLAKPFAGPATVSGSMTPTIASGSMAGGIFGTVAYMSPEQARGKDLDARTDIWAFGCVLYEMLTGQLAFGGETATDAIARIVTGHADLDVLPSDAPVSIRLLLTATLQKNLQQRLQHIGDARLFLDQAFAAQPSAGSPAAASVQRPRRQAGVIGAAFLAGLVAAVAPVAWYLRPRPQPAGAPMRLQLVLPNFVVGPSLSPDGQRIVYAGAAPGENLAVWVRSIGSESAEKLAGTDRPSGVAWSPDSHSIALISDGKLKRVDLTTRSVQVLWDVGLENLRGMSWGSSGVILLGRKNVLYRVPVDGGTPAPVMPIDTAHGETLHALPVFLPDGNHFFFVSLTSEREKSGIFVGSLDGKTKSYVMPLGTRLNSLGYVPGYLLIGGDDLIAQPFDDKTLTSNGAAVPIVDGLGNSWAASNNGVLLFQKASTVSANKQLTWFDRTGKQLGQLGAAANYGNIEISPAGDRVAVDTMIDGNRDVWVIDVARAVPSRLTFDPAADWTPVWSPDGSQILFASGRTGGSHMFQRAASGVGSDRLVFKSDSSEIPVSWSHDGRYVVFSRFKATAGVDTWLMSMAGEPTAKPFIESPFDKAQARVSPDSRWISYVTNDSGTYQVVVQSFPDPNGGRWQITAQGGIEPKWKHDGRELYYLAPDGKLMAVPINPGPPFQTGSPSVLFQTPLVVGRSQAPRDRRYDVAPDGRFLIAVPTSAAATQASVTAVVNWTALTNR